VNKARRVVVHSEFLELFLNFTNEVAINSILQGITSDENTNVGYIPSTFNSC
jgi:hypothetical protein